MHFFFTPTIRLETPSIIENDADDTASLRRSYAEPKHLSLLQIIAFIVENTPQSVRLTQTINPLRKRLVRHVLLSYNWAEQLK